MSTSIVFVCLSTLFFGLCASEKLIIDTDAGADDAAAILLLLRALAAKDPSVPSYEVIGITCSYGNTNEQNAETNIRKTLTVAQRSGIPIFAGSKRSLLEKFETDNYFGQDGLGDADFSLPLATEVDKSKRAPEALIELAKTNKGNVSIVALGPLTNLALAISLDNDFPSYVKNFYVMGGSVHGVGNKAPNVEFNMGADPESDAIVFDSIKTEKQIVLVPWETTADMTLITKDWRRNVLGASKTPYVEFLNAIEAISLANEKTTWDCPDAMVSAILIKPEIITKSEALNVQPVFSGQARGSLLVDYYNLTKKLRNTNIVMSIDASAYKQLLLRYLSCENPPCQNEL